MIVDAVWKEEIDADGNKSMVMQLSLADEHYRHRELIDLTVKPVVGATVKVRVR